MNPSKAIVLLTLVAMYAVFAVMAEDVTGSGAKPDKCDEMVTVDVYARPGASVKKSCKRACREKELHFVSSVEPKHLGNAYDPLRGDHSAMECCCSSKKWGLF